MRSAVVFFVKSFFGGLSEDAEEVALIGRDKVLYAWAEARTPTKGSQNPQGLHVRFVLSLFLSGRTTFSRFDNLDTLI